VVFIGDSITAGLHLDAEDAFPAVLQREAEEAGLPFRLVNAGVSGDTTAGGLRRVDWLLRQEPDLVVVELGGNDGLRGVAVDAIEENLRAIVEKLTAGGARVLLLGVRLPPNYGPDYTGAFEALYDRVAEETGVAYVPFFMEGVGGVARLIMADGLHPTAAGHEGLARTVWPALRDVLEALAAD
jgi:acyl-CoA thioesterase-1